MQKIKLSYVPMLIILDVLLLMHHCLMSSLLLQLVDVESILYIIHCWLVQPIHYMLEVDQMVCMNTLDR